MKHLTAINSEIPKYAFGAHELSRANKLAKLVNIKTFHNDVRELVKNVTSDSVIKNWQRLSEARYNELEANLASDLYELYSMGDALVIETLARVTENKELYNFITNCWTHNQITDDGSGQDYNEFKKEYFEIIKKHTGIDLLEVVNNDGVISTNQDQEDTMKKYYDYLENLRISGVTNMYGAGEYLERNFGLGRKEAADILSAWMGNYSELKEKYNW